MNAMMNSLHKIIVKLLMEMISQKRKPVSKISQKSQLVTVQKVSNNDTLTILMKTAFLFLVKINLILFWLNAILMKRNTIVIFVLKASNLLIFIMMNTVI